ncbi:STAS domain-containing protein [Thiobacter aerophilum]|uniref:STAS domain-containing protein n=1 Tax=Thiobacter aerophilum TaxID=3121275 RepID=A0ABV0EDQ9_9BURK
MSAIRREGDRLTVSGPIHISNARALLAQGAALLAPEVTLVDLAEVTDVDSAAVSLLLEWQRQAARLGRRLRFAHLPASLKSLAVLYGVTELLPEEA